MNAQHNTETLYMAMETSQKSWGLHFTTGRKTRRITIAAWDLPRLDQELEKTLKKMGRAESCQIFSCYEAGRDGFSIHRMLKREFSIENVVVDPASIEVDRRKRRRKTDRLDGDTLARMLFRFHVLDERKVWSVVRVPSVLSEDERRLGREMDRLKKEKNQHVCRIKSLLATLGIPKVNRVHDCDLSKIVSEGRTHLLAELQRQQTRLTLVREQLKEIAKQRQECLKNPRTESDRVAAKLMRLKAIGLVGSWDLSKEFFGWRKFKNRRQVGALAGLTGTPYDSGSSRREQGISKAGRTSVRSLMVQLSWLWLRHQPDSELTKWYYNRFDSSDAKETGLTNRRCRKIGIVALARKLLVALWKYVEFDVIPEGAVFKDV